MSEGFEQMYGDMVSSIKALPAFRTEEVKVAAEECVNRYESLQDIMKDPERESTNGTLALINQSLIDQKVNEMVGYQLQRLFRLEEFASHGPLLTKQLIEKNGTKAEQKYFKSFSKLMNYTAVKIGHDFDLTTDLTPPSELFCKAKITKTINDIFLPVSGSSSFKENEIVSLCKQDLEVLGKQSYVTLL